MINKYLMAKNDTLALAAVLRGMPPQPTEAQIKANKVPVLALIGEVDPAKAGVDRLNGLMPNLKTRRNSRRQSWDGTRQSGIYKESEGFPF